MGLLALLGCTSPTNDSDDPVVSIRDVGWSIDNISPLYFPDGESKGLYYTFWVYYEGEVTNDNLSAVTMVLSDGETLWTLYNAEKGKTSNLDTARHRVGSSRYWYDGISNSLPLGTMTAVLELKDGTKVTKTWTPHHPGKNTPATADYVVNEDYSGSALLDRVSALSRPTSVRVSTSVDTLTASFDLDDGLAHNGFLWFYDADKNYLGNSDYLRNTGTGEVSTWVNGGVWKPSGANALAVPLSALNPESGSAAELLSAVKYVVVVLRDGNQYETSGQYDNGYDYRSISGMTLVE